MNKSLLVVSVLSVLGLSACGSKESANPCADYVSAVESCYGADLPDVGFDEATLCAGSDGIAAAYYTCLADAYDAGDCTTSEGLTAISTDVAACVP